MTSSKPLMFRSCVSFRGNYVLVHFLAISPEHQFDGKTRGRMTFSSFVCSSPFPHHFLKKPPPSQPPNLHHSTMTYDLACSNSAGRWAQERRKAKDDLRCSKLGRCFSALPATAPLLMMSWALLKASNSWRLMGRKRWGQTLGGMWNREWRICHTWIYSLLSKSPQKPPKSSQQDSPPFSTSDVHQRLWPFCCRSFSDLSHTSHLRPFRTSPQPSRLAETILG